MQHCFEEGSKGGKACNSQTSNDKKQGEIKLYQYSLVYRETSRILVKIFSSSNHITFVGKVDQLFAINVGRLGI